MTGHYSDALLAGWQAADGPAGAAVTALPTRTALALSRSPRPAKVLVLGVVAGLDVWHVSRIVGDRPAAVGCWPAGAAPAGARPPRPTTCNTLRGGGALASAMRRLLQAHHDRLALDEGTAERLLAGRLGSADLPPAYAPVADLLAAAAAPPDAEELAGEAAAVARFQAAARARPESRLHGRSGVFTKLLTVKAAAVALGMLAAGGVAAAATGTLPAPAQQVAHAVFGSATFTGSTATTASTATTVTTTAAQARAVGPDAAGPAARGLCRGWAAGQGGQHGRKLDAVAFAALAKAAGGGGKVAAYCATVTAGGAAPSSAVPSSSAAPSTTGGSGRGGSPSSVPPSMVPSSTTPPTTHGGPPTSLPPSTAPSSTAGH